MDTVHAGPKQSGGRFCTFGDFLLYDTVNSRHPFTPLCIVLSGKPHSAVRSAGLLILSACGGLTWVFLASPAHASPRQTNRHTLQETSRIAYLDDLIVVIRIGDVGTFV